MTKWLWYINLSLAAGILLVLIIGLSTLPDSSLHAASPAANLSPDDPSASSQGSAAATSASAATSPLILAAANFAKRLAPPPPPKPTVPKVVAKPPTNGINKPTIPTPPPPPPKPQPKPKPPAPNFAVDSTFVTGRFEGDTWLISESLAWIIAPNENNPKVFTVGDKIEQYTITAITEGAVELHREGFNFTIKVPEPQIEAPTIALPPQPPASSPIPPTPASPEKPPIRPRPSFRTPASQRK